MNPLKRVELFEKMYYHELDRRERINARLSTPLGALIGTSGVLAFLINGRAQSDGADLDSIFWALFTSALLALLIGAWKFRNAWFGQTDRYIATAAEMDDYYLKLREQLKGAPDMATQVDSSFEQYLLDTYRRSATTNALNNDKRSTALHYAGCWLTTAVALSLVSTIPYYLGKVQDHDRKEATSSTAAPASST